MQNNLTYIIIYSIVKKKIIIIIASCEWLYQSNNNSKVQPSSPISKIILVDVSKFPIYHLQEPQLENHRLKILSTIRLKFLKKKQLQENPFKLQLMS